MTLGRLIRSLYVPQITKRGGKPENKKNEKRVGGGILLAPFTKKSPLRACVVRSDTRADMYEVVRRRLARQEKTWPAYFFWRAQSAGVEGEAEGPGRLSDVASSSYRAAGSRKERVEATSVEDRLLYTPSCGHSFIITCYYVARRQSMCRACSSPTST